MISLLFAAITGLVSIFWFLLTLGMLVQLWKDDGRESSNKILWTLGIVFFPILGPVVFMLSRR